jgi:hypothetical protein
MYLPSEVEVLERQTVWRDGRLFGSKGGQMIAATAAGKEESRRDCGISNRSGKPGFGFPRRGFSTAVRTPAMVGLECAAYDGPLL